MQSNDIVEVVKPLGGGNGQVILSPDAATILAGTAGDPAPLSIFNPIVAI